MIAEDREAMAYYKTLPDDIKCEISKNADKFRTIESLKKYAAGIAKKS
jgi:hypothetical protein